MKLPVFLLLVCNAMALAAERPSAFLGIPWGASPEEAKRILQQRPGVQFPENADDYRIELTGGTFAGQPVAKWVIEFPSRKFASAVVTLKTEGNASSIYKEFRAQLVSKYGSATTDKKTGTSSKTQPQPPQGPGSMSVWKFMPTMKDKTTVFISAELAGGGGQGNESRGTVTIKYVNETLAGTADGGKDGPKLAAPVKKEEL